MFSPQSNIDFTKLWNALGTFFKSLPAEAKERFEAFWKSVIDAVETLYFNMAQANEGYYLWKTPGWIESGLWEKQLIFKDLLGQKRENTSIVYLNAPFDFTVSSSTPVNNEDTLVNYYKISSYNSSGESLPSKEIIIKSSNTTDLLTYPNIINFSPVENATGYYLYKKINTEWQRVAESTNTSFTDNGILTPTQNLPLTKPTGISYYKTPIWDNSGGGYYWTWIKSIKLLEINTTVSNFIIKNGREIWFPYTVETDTNTELLKIGGTYQITEGLVMLPSLEKIFLKSYWNHSIDYWFQTYIPWEYNWTPNTESGEKTKLEHLKNWCWALQYWLNQPPTLETLTNAWSIFLGYPFYPGEGSVTNKTGNIITITGELSGSKTYDLKSYNSIYNVSDTVPLFSPLISGCEVVDIYKDPDSINSIKYLYPIIDPTCLIWFKDANNFLNHDLKSEFLKKLSPAGLLTHF